MNFTVGQLNSDSDIDHPYYPLGVVIPSYAANESHFVAIVSIFLSGWAVIIGAVWIVSKRINPRLSIFDRLTLTWFALCGFIHLFFEGYFAINHRRMGPAQDLFGQLWKEYSLSDSRYLTSDAFLVWMESVTAFIWGPLSFALVYFILSATSTANQQHPYRHITQALVSMGQIYGDVLYYATSLFEYYGHGLEFCRPERYYFWGYYVFFNAIWIVVPAVLLVHSVRRIGQVFREHQQHQSTVSRSQVRMNGHTKAE